MYATASVHFSFHKRNMTGMTNLFSPEKRERVVTGWGLGGGKWHSAVWHTLLECKEDVLQKRFMIPPDIILSRIHTFHLETMDQEKSERRCASRDVACGCLCGLLRV